MGAKSIRPPYHFAPLVSLPFTSLLARCSPCTGGSAVWTVGTRTGAAFNTAAGRAPCRFSERAEPDRLQLVQPVRAPPGRDFCRSPDVEPLLLVRRATHSPAAARQFPRIYTTSDCGRLNGRCVSTSSVCDTNHF